MNLNKYSIQRFRESESIVNKFRVEPREEFEQRFVTWNIILSNLKQSNFKLDQRL